MKSILILDAFITDDNDEIRLNDFIDDSRSIGDDVMLMSNTKISKTIQDKVDYFFYDKRNQLFTEEYDNYEYVSYYILHNNFKISNIFPHTQPHALSVLINLFRSVKIAKDLGYTHFYKMEYDGILGDETIKKIKELNDSCVLENKKAVFFIENHINNTSLVVHYFFCEIDYFLNNFWNISCEQDYINFLNVEKKNKDFLIMERFMYENMNKLDSNDLNIINDFDKYFSDTTWNSKHSRVYFNKKYKECYTRFYINDENPNEVVIYSRNLKSEPTVRKIIITFNDGSETEITHHLHSYGVWNLHSLNSDIEKMRVYDEYGFLFEEYFKNTLNKIEYI
jgi:hypothetical protein